MRVSIAGLSSPKPSRVSARISPAPPQTFSGSSRNTVSNWTVIQCGLHARKTIGSPAFSDFSTCASIAGVPLATSSQSPSP